MIDLRRTKIVATIGPASGSSEMIRALAEAGMDAVRLNFSHGTPRRARRLRRGVVRAGAGGARAGRSR